MSTTANVADVEWVRVKRGRPCGKCQREDGLCSRSTDGKLRRASGKEGRGPRKRPTRPASRSGSTG